jgi:hypothetical protein
MEMEELILLLGYSEFSPEIKAFLETRGKPKIQDWFTQKDYEWKDLKLVFQGKANYVHYYGNPVKAYRKGWNESFLKELSIGDSDRIVKLSFPLPWALKFGDAPAQVRQKLTIRPSKKSADSSGSHEIYHTDSYCVLAGYSKSGRLSWLCITLHEKNFLAKRKLRKTVTAPGKKDISGLKLLAKKSPLPVAEKEVKIYFENLRTAKTPGAILSAVKKLVLSINKLNKKTRFIETGEREEFVTYIQKAVKLAGMNVKKGTDLTSEWREW